MVPEPETEPIVAEITYVLKIPRVLAQRIMKREQPAYTTRDRGQAHSAWYDELEERIPMIASSLIENCFDRIDVEVLG